MAKYVQKFDAFMKREKYNINNRWHNAETTRKRNPISHRKVGETMKGGIFASHWKIIKVSGLTGWPMSLRMKPNYLLKK